MTTAKGLKNVTTPNAAKCSKLEKWLKINRSSKTKTLSKRNTDFDNRQTQ